MSAENAKGGSPFSPRAVLSLLVIGAVAFIAALYFMGAGDTSRIRGDGGAHGAGTGLNGYAALVELLEARGYEVSNIRNQSRLDDESMLVLTPPPGADPEEINDVITRHRTVGPVLLILPKWIALPVPQGMGAKAEPGWVMLLGAATPDWTTEIGREGLLTPALDRSGETAQSWRGLGLSGILPAPQAVQSIASNEFVPLVSAGARRHLVSFWNDGGYYPELAYAAATTPYDENEADTDLWPVVVVAEPDLMNNYGLADRERAMLALAIVETTLEGYDLPIAFDLTFNGYGQSENLLTLAFRPPFLAATLCLIIAALVVGWRALRRFGPPLAGAPVFAFGKRQLATNGAALIQRSKRLHLLGAPYAAILRSRIAQALGLRPSADPAVTESQIDEVLERRGIEPADFSTQADALRQAKGPHELLRRAHALKQIERKLAR